MTRILMMSERRVIGRTPIFVVKFRTWRPRRTNQVAMSASNNRRAILVLFMTATQGAPNHHIRPRIGEFRADLAVAKANENRQLPLQRMSQLISSSASIWL